MELSMRYITSTTNDFLSPSPYSNQMQNRVENTIFFRLNSTGKELDEETGYGYFGARYMDHELMTGWLSVDPMADKYPNISPYAYCNWNPVKLVDPDGRDFDPIMQEYASSLRKYCNSQITKLEKVGSLMDRQREQLNGFRNTIFEMDKLENDHSTLYCFGKHENNKANEDIMGFTSYGGVNEGKNVINITIREDGFLEGGGLNMKGAGAFAHELKHAFQFYSGESAFAIKEGIESLESIAYNSSELETSAYNRGALFGGLNAIQKNKLSPETFIFPYGNLNKFESDFSNAGYKIVKH